MGENKKVTTNRINTLTVARFAAIMLIVINHFEFLQQYGKLGELYQRYFHSATIGVDFFFMLSGFGMMLSSTNRDPNGTEFIGGGQLIAFARRHVKKIYPIYIVMLLLGIPYYLLAGYFEYGKKIVTGVLQAIVYFIMDTTLLQSAAGLTNLSHSLNGVSWFLSSLFCIYLISPIIMKWLKLHVKNEKQAALGIGISIFGSFMLAILFSKIEEYTIFDDLCYGAPYRRVFYVISGMLVAQMYNFRKNGCLCKKRSWIENGRVENVCIVITMVYVLLRNSLLENIGSYIYIFDMMIVVVDLYLLALGKGIFSRLFENRYMVYLGNISMYIFITHWLIRMYVDFYVQRMGIESVAVALLEVVIILILTFVVSVIIERNGNVSQKSKKIV